MTETERFSALQSFLLFKQMNLANCPVSVCSIKSPHKHDRKNCLSLCNSKNQLVPENKNPVTPIKKLSEQSMMGALEKTYFPNAVRKKKNSYFSQNIEYSSQPKSNRSQFKLPSTQNNFSKDNTTIFAPRSIGRMSKELINHSKKSESKHKKKLSIVKNRPDKQIKKSTKRIETSPSHKKVEPNVFLTTHGRKPTQRVISCSKQRSQEKRSENNSLFCPGFWQNEEKTINIIKRSEKNKCLVHENSTNGIFFFYQIIDSQYLMSNFEDLNIMKVFCEFGTKSYLLEPYEYTLNQLIALNKISPKSMSAIHKEVKAVKESIEKQIRRPAQLAPISEIAYFIHGNMKILPLIRKKYLLSNAIHSKKLRSK